MVYCHKESFGFVDWPIVVMDASDWSVHVSPSQCQEDDQTPGLWSRLPSQLQEKQKGHHYHHDYHHHHHYYDIIMASNIMSRTDKVTPRHQS